MPQIKGKFLFDIIMECIDNNIGEGEITSCRNSALRAIAKATTYNIKDIKSFFLLTTGNSLEWYYRQRRLYYAFGQMKKYPEKCIGVIANFYGYADSASFNHAFKQAFSVTPTQARANPELVKDNRLVYGDFQQAEVTKQSVENKSYNEEIRILDLYNYEEYGLKEFGFDPALSREIAALADKLGIQVYEFMNSCFDSIIDAQSDSEYLSPEIEAAIDLGISSPSELEQICQYYDCQYYELNSFMVDYYRQNIGKPDEE